MPDASEVVIVVFGDEEEVIDQTHGLLEARVEQCAGQRRAGEIFQAVEEREAL